MALLGLAFSFAGARAQDANVLHPVPEIERLFARGEFEVISFKGARFPGDRTYQATLEFIDGPILQAQWAPAPAGGGEFNNRPRLDIAAYEIQKLFLDPEDYPVPPTVGRFIPLDEHPRTPPEAAPIEPTFSGWDATLVVLQYWLFNIDPNVDPREEILDPDRFDRDPTYAKHMANFNLLTYLIRHRDSNRGNFLVSTDSANPRVFSVDNGISFSGGESTIGGAHWEEIRVDAFPRASIERLRSLTREDVDRVLGVVAQFEAHEAGRLEATDPTDNLGRSRGIRRGRSVVQFGLIDSEIRRVWERIQRLLEDVDEGRYRVF